MIFSPRSDEIEVSRKLLMVANDRSHCRIEVRRLEESERNMFDEEDEESWNYKFDRTNSEREDRPKSRDFCFFVLRAPDSKTEIGPSTWVFHCSVTRRDHGQKTKPQQNSNRLLTFDNNTHRHIG